MASDEPLPYGRSSSRTTRIFQEILTSDQRSLFVGKKSQLTSVSDKLVWFSPVHSPLLSPAREKSTEKKKSRQNSIFSIQSRGKGSNVADEPTSPKVSCIGQVRGRKKDKDPFAEAPRKKGSLPRPGSTPLARFFASPGRAGKWHSLFGPRKERCTANAGLSGNGEANVSCFGVPLDPQIKFPTEKACSFLARCPDLSPECSSSDNWLHDQEMHPGTRALDSECQGQGICSPTRKCIDANAIDKPYSHALTTASISHFPREKRGHELPEGIMVVPRKIAEIGNLTGFENCSQGDCHDGSSPVSRQTDLNYEDLPSLHCGNIMKQHMKISVEVVPETWLWRNGETLRPDTTSHLKCVQDQSISTSREDPQHAQHDELIRPVSPCADCQASKDGEQRVNYQIQPGHFYMTDCGAADMNKRTNETLVKTSLNSVVESSFAPSDAREKIMNGAEDILNAETSRSKPMDFSCCMHVAEVEEEGESHGVTCTTACRATSKTDHSRSGKQQFHLEKSRNESVVDESGGVQEYLEAKPSRQTMERIGVDPGKENYGIAFPSLFGKDRKPQTFSKQPFSALIVVGYDQLAASKNPGCKDEELFRGVLEVAGLSVYGSGKYFQVLSNDATFNRSYSATSVRTVIRLQRCNSDPCRPSS